MRTARIVMPDPCHQYAAEMELCQRNHHVQACLPECSQYPFAEGIGLRPLRWCFEYPQAQMAYLLIELLREDAIAVMEQEAVAVVRWDRFAQLLERPLRWRMRGHIDVQPSAAGVCDDDKDVEETKGRGDHDPEVTGHHTPGMMTDKGRPALRLTSCSWVSHTGPRPILAYGARRRPQAELQQEFVRNPLLAPRRILSRPLTGQGLQLRWNPWPSRTRLPAPEQLEPLTMPTEKGGGLHNGEDLAPITPAPKPDQGEAGGVAGTPGRGVTLLIQRKLFAQEEVFGREGRTEAQTEEEQAPRITQKHEQEASEPQQVAESSGTLRHREGRSQSQKVGVSGYYPSWEPHRPEWLHTHAPWPVHALTGLRQGAPIIADYRWKQLSRLALLKVACR